MLIRAIDDVIHERMTPAQGKAIAGLAAQLNASLMVELAAKRAAITDGSPLGELRLTGPK